MATNPLLYLALALFLSCGLGRALDAPHNLQPREIPPVQSLLSQAVINFCISFNHVVDTTSTFTVTGTGTTQTITSAPSPCTVTLKVVTVTQINITYSAAPTSMATLAAETLFVTTIAPGPVTTITQTASQPVVTNTETETDTVLSTITETVTSVSSPLRKRNVATSSSTVVSTIQSAANNQGTFTSSKGSTTASSISQSSTSSAKFTTSTIGTAQLCTIKDAVIGNFPHQSNICSAISSACSTLVQPKQVSITKTVPGPTMVTTVTPTAVCQTLTPLTTLQVMVTNPATTTIILTSTPPAITSTSTITETTTTKTSTVTPAPDTTVFMTTVTTTSVTTTTSTVITGPINDCASIPNPTTIGEVSYNIYCNVACGPPAFFDGNDFHAYAPTFSDCIQNLRYDHQATYDSSTGLCYVTYDVASNPKFGASGPNFACAQAI